MANDIKEDIKVFVDNSFDKLNEMLSVWYSKLMEENSVILAIARKAPRLLEWCKINFPETENDKNVIISEIALPFISKEDLGEKCRVVDEAIYHGTTFEKVLKTVQAFVGKSKVKVSGLPVVVTQDALDAPNITDTIERGWSLIDSTNCNFFIDSIISKFFELGKPYDIEYPLFYIDLPVEKEYEYKEIDSIIESVLRKTTLFAGAQVDGHLFYKTKNFRREDSEVFSAFTYCTDYFYVEQVGILKPDFSKFRIFHTDKRICIASMSPYTIREDCLTAESKLFSGDYAGIWKLIRGRVKDSTDVNLRRQTGKSLVVIANYLLSVNHFSHFRKQFIDLFSEELGYEVSVTMDEADLRLLLGASLAFELRKILPNMSVMEEPSASNSADNALPALIPIGYDKDYFVQLSLDNMFDKNNISSIVSNMMSDLHWMVEIPSRKRSRDFYSRLEFGESMHFVKKMCNELLPESDNSYLIHQNVDMRIDRGSMVPDYVCVDDAFDKYWRRMFRSGENEDLCKDQYLRIGRYVLLLYFNKLNTNVISNVELTLLFGLLAQYEQIFPIRNNVEQINPIYAVRTVIENEGGEYKIYLNSDDANKQELLDKLQSYHFLKEVAFGSYELAELSNSRLFAGNLPVSKEVQRQMQRIVDFVVYAHNNEQEDTLSEFQNYACTSISNLTKCLKTWMKKLIFFVNGGSADSFEDLESLYVNIYMAVPEPQLELHINTFASSSVGTWLKNKIESTEIKENAIDAIHKLSVSFYLVNLWNKVDNNEVSQYYDPEVYDSFESLGLNEEPIGHIVSECGRSLETGKIVEGKKILQKEICNCLEHLI